MQKSNMNQCRWSPTLGDLEDTAEHIWGTKPYTNPDDPCVFFGVYGLPDFYTLWRHKGKKWILWAGSDIKHFQNGYWLDEIGNIRIDPEAFAKWINENCESWCENEVERVALQDVGIYANVAQSFLGNVKDYKIEWQPNERPQVFLSANPGREVEYGWKIIEDIADKCNADFHLYGSSSWESKHHNVIVHGRIPKEKMNEQIKKMQCGLRLNEFDGASEITIKSLLWGQYPIVRAEFKYPFLSSFTNKDSLIRQINELKNKTGSNPAREFYIKNLNAYPWNHK